MDVPIKAIEILFDFAAEGNHLKIEVDYSKQIHIYVHSFSLSGGMLLNQDHLREIKTLDDIDALILKHKKERDYRLYLELAEQFKEGDHAGS